RSSPADLTIPSRLPLRSSASSMPVGSTCHAYNTVWAPARGPSSAMRWRVATTSGLASRIRWSCETTRALRETPTWLPPWPSWRLARSLQSEEEPIAFRELAQDRFRDIPARLPAVLAHKVLDSAPDDEQDRVRSQLSLLEFLPVQRQERRAFRDEFRHRCAEFVVPLKRLGSPDPLDEWTVDGIHPGPQCPQHSMGVAVAGHHPLLPRGGVTDLAGRIPAARPIR